MSVLMDKVELYRKQLKKDTFDYFKMSALEASRFGTGYYTTLDANTPLPSDDPQEIHEKVYKHGKRTDLLNNCEFNLLRNDLYDALLIRSAEKVKTAFVHGSGIGHEAMILAGEGVIVYYYEPDEEKKKFQKWREERRLSELLWRPVDVTDWKAPIKMELDMVVSYDVLEHLHAPFRTILHLGEFLHEEGRFVVMPAFQYPKHKQHLPQHEWISPYMFTKVMQGLGFKLIWQQGSFFEFQPIFNKREEVWKL